MNNNEPKTWNELLEAGYVTELTEEQVAMFKLKTGQLDKGKISYDPEEISERNHNLEAATRKLGGK